MPQNFKNLRTALSGTNDRAYGKKMICHLDKQRVNAVTASQWVTCWARFCISL